MTYRPAPDQPMIRIRGARAIERSNLVIDMLQQHLGLSAAQVDAVFVAAAAL